MTEIADIEGIGPVFAEKLTAAGLDTMKELATRRPANLHARMIQAYTSKNLVRRAPTMLEVESWVAEAKAPPAMVTH